MKAVSRIADRFLPAILCQFLFGDRAQAYGEWEFTALDKDGNVKWREKIKNLVVNEGLNELLNAALAAQSPVTSWFVGLKATGTVVAGDTMGSHSGWTEITAYDEANRPAWTPNGAASSQSVSNSSSRATFTINDTVEVFGAFLTSNNTKGGTTGKLYAAGNFSASRNLVATDVLLVTATFGTQSA